MHDPRGIHSSGDWAWMVTDGLGSVRSVLDDSFDPLYSTHYAPYGDPWGAAGTDPTDFGFTGEQTDANGLVYLRARYYDPALGMFPSLDPLEGEIERAMSLNRYTYVAGNVVNRVDPSGEIGCGPIPTCPQGGFPSFGGVWGPQWACCWDYRPDDAVSYAKRHSDEVNNPDPRFEYYYSQRSDGSWNTNCANFVSQSLREGGHPMAYPGGASTVDTTSDTYWACTGTSKCSGTRTWRLAGLLAAYLRNQSPQTVMRSAADTDGDQLFEFGWHVPSPCSCTCSHADCSPLSGCLCDPDTGEPPSDCNCVPHNCSCNVQAYHTIDWRRIKGAIQDISDALNTTGIGYGDVMYLRDSDPDHVAMLVGWGPLKNTWGDVSGVDPTLFTTRMNSTDVPYIVDNGRRSWNQVEQDKPVPFYLLRIVSSQGARHRYIGNHWEFIKIPSRFCMVPDDFVPFSIP